MQADAEDWPGKGLNVPWGHGRQVLWKPPNDSKYDPAAHGMQSNEDELPTVRVELPAGHNVQADTDDWPGMELNVPWGHAMQIWDIAV